MTSAIQKWADEHPDLWEFIKFNVLSNLATITNFVLLWIGTNILFDALSNNSFHWFIFHYDEGNGGFGGFLSFLIAYTGAQIVNYIVQRKFVFGAENSIKSTLHWYILTVVVAGFISIVLPQYTTNIFLDFGLNLTISQTLANVINILIQVAINYPMMKFVIMKKHD
ncbi:GtrA family protein [Marinilactibacillus kalidii]|uniref:GtrA family protein n=1 Tax=Marinilactibacillus kalidii TaxID=2820274 RepID=UPI001FC92B4D|nr:GtrA family protein [Marinilactibacillus kalidii]